MQCSSLPINSSLQNNPRYTFLLKSENIEILSILSAVIRSRFFLVRIFYQPYLIYMPSLVEIPLAVSDISKVKDFDIRSRFPWQRRPFWKFQDLNAPLEMGIHLPVKFSKDRIASLWEFGRTNWLRRRRGGIIIIIRRNGAKTISLQTSFGDLIIIRNAAKTIGLQT
jgi:hypothetical protein